MFGKIRNLIISHRLIAFLSLAFGYTWAIQITLARFAPHLAQLPGSLRLAAYGPSLAALVVPPVTSGAKGSLDFLRRRLAPRGNPAWYAISLLTIPTLLLILRGVHLLLFPDFPLEMPHLRGQAPNILLGFLAALTFGPFAEELGWRGFALPELQKRFSPLTASLVLGLIWWAWHLPQLLLPAYQWAVGGMPVLLYLALIMPGSILAAWIYNKSRGSVLPVILFHGSMNYFMGLLGFNSPYFLLFVLGGMWTCAILVAIWTGAELIAVHNLDQARQEIRTENV